jgi:hypothetical protein
VPRVLLLYDRQSNARASVSAKQRDLVAPLVVAAVAGLRLVVARIRPPLLAPILVLFLSVLVPSRAAGYVLRLPQSICWRVYVWMASLSCV